jgi:3D-(3,5/4)-trihydroxycyclohexane-1,2-dione acylhydrolase (decyclizing)
MGQAVVHFIASQYTLRDGIEQRFIAGVWGIFGHGNLAGIGQALEEYGEELALQHYRPQNEQGMVHVAAAFTKHQNRLQTYACAASIGPGSLNMVTGAALATINRLPVLLLPSDYFANHLPDPVLQQMEHPSERDSSANDAFRPVSRYFDRISRPEQILSSLPEAFRILTDPSETGAVTLSLCEDVQTESYDYPLEFFAKRVWRIRRPVPEPELVTRACELIRAAKRPLIVAGGGVTYSGANTELEQFASLTGIPVSETQASKGVLPWNHNLNLGLVGTLGTSAANILARDADLVIAIGTRLADFPTASKSAFQNPDVQFIGINVAAMDAHKQNALPVVGDAKRTLSSLLEQLEHHKTPLEYQTQIANIKLEWDKIVDDLRTIKDPNNLAQAEVIGMVNDAAGGHGVMICAAGSMPGDLPKIWRPTDPKSYHLEYGFSCMGYEIPAALGVKLAEPSREVYVMVGDGSYLMMNSEIVTAVQEGLKPIIIVVDNHGFQSIHSLQRSQGSPTFGLELRYREENSRYDGPFIPVDYAMHGLAMGARAWTAHTESEFKASLAAAKKSDRISIIHVFVDPEKRVGGFESWWDAPPAEVSNQKGVQNARAEYVEKIKKQRPYLKVTK